MFCSATTLLQFYFLLLLHFYGNWSRRVVFCGNCHLGTCKMLCGQEGLPKKPFVGTNTNVRMYKYQAGLRMREYMDAHKDDLQNEAKDPPLIGRFIRSGKKSTPDLLNTILFRAYIFGYEKIRVGAFTEGSLVHVGILISSFCENVVVDTKSIYTCKQQGECATERVSISPKGACNNLRVILYVCSLWHAHLRGAWTHTHQLYAHLRIDICASARMCIRPRAHV
eukprot:XP_002260995.1 hypothetical protein PKH_031110 [Plasmodium knowlesi strain H]